MRWQKIALGPALLFALALVGAAAFWLQKAEPADADIGPYYRYYEGTANVKVKNGNAYSTFPVYTCTVVETNGANGDMLDVMIFGYNINETFGSDSEEMFCGDMICICDGDPQSSIDDSDVPEMLPGTFLIITWINEGETGGLGWKNNPVKQTSTQWTFTMKKPLAPAGMVILNNDARPLQANTTLLAKFIRGREGLYWKVAGTAPLNGNGTPKVTVEIESPITGHDSPPSVVSTNPWDSEIVDSDTSMTVDFSEPVNIDPEGADLYCYGAGEYFDLTISGQGTTSIVIDPVLSLPLGDSCQLHIYGDAISDVDTIDPPDVSLDDVWLQFNISDGCLCALIGPDDNVLDI